MTPVYRLFFVSGSPVEVTPTNYGDRLSAGRDAAWWAEATGRPIAVAEVDTCPICRGSGAV
jgi:hypothetical protein